MSDDRLRADAPLLDAWLTFTEQAAAGAVRPFTIPGHKQRRDLVGDVVAGDVPLYAGLDTMKLTRGVLADAEQRAAAFWGAVAAFVADAVVTVAVTLVTKPKPIEELQGLVYGMANVEENQAADERVWYRKPWLLGAGALGLVVALNIAFI